MDRMIDGHGQKYIPPPSAGDKEKNNAGPNQSSS